MRCSKPWGTLVWLTPYCSGAMKRLVVLLCVVCVESALNHLHAQRIGSRRALFRRVSCFLMWCRFMSSVGRCMCARMGQKRFVFALTWWFDEVK